MPSITAAAFVRMPFISSIYRCIGTWAQLLQWKLHGVVTNSTTGPGGSPPEGSDRACAARRRREIPADLLLPGTVLNQLEDALLRADRIVRQDACTGRRARPAPVSAAVDGDTERACRQPDGVCPAGHGIVGEVRA